MTGELASRLLEYRVKENSLDRGKLLLPCRCRLLRRESDSSTLIWRSSCSRPETSDLNRLSLRAMGTAAQRHSPSTQTRHQDRGLSPRPPLARGDRKSTRLNSSHQIISYAVFCLKKKRGRSA